MCQSTKGVTIHKFLQKWKWENCLRFVLNVFSSAPAKLVLCYKHINLKCSQKLFIYWEQKRVVMVENYKLEKLVAKSDFPTILYSKFRMK